MPIGGWPTEISFCFRLLSIALLWGIAPLLCAAAENKATRSPAEFGEMRAPVDLALSSDGRYLVSVNQVRSSLSLVSLQASKVIDEADCGAHPSGIAWTSDEELIVTCTDAGTVERFRIAEGKLVATGKVRVGFEPVGIAVDRDRKKAFVGLSASAQVAEINLTSNRVDAVIEAGPWPRYLALSPDGSRLAVSAAGDGKAYVIDTSKREVVIDEALSGGINLGHMQTSRDGKYVYFPSMIYRTNPINVRNIQLGWVLASRIVRVRLDESAVREAISLDVPRLAVSDPHGLVLSPNEHRLLVTASGTHELLVYRLEDLPFEGVGGPGDLIDPRLTRDRDLFSRIELGGRPMGLVAAPDNRTVYIANYLRDSIQIVDYERREVIGEIELGTPDRSLPEFRGMEIFYDGRRSLDQWYSCHTCHYNGGINSRAMDTKNDGSDLTFKTVLPLEGVSRTGPWTWHGWQENLPQSIAKSFTESMQGPPINDSDVKAVIAYLDSRPQKPSPFREPDGSLSSAAARGKALFESDRTRCAECHSGPHFTDGQIHDVGLGSESDRYNGYNTPTLVGLYRKVRFLHDGRTKSLDTLLSDMHSPEKVSGTQNFTDAERADLIAYLKSL